MGKGLGTIVEDDESEYEDVGSLDVPESVKQSDLVEALLPLCALLGITPDDFYVKPGLMIYGNDVTFSVPAGRLGEQGRWGMRRRPLRPAEAGAQRIRTMDELSIVVTVKVEDDL